MSPGVLCNDLLFLTGMTGHRSDGTFADDPEEQIREVFGKIASVLTEAGLSMSDIVEMTSYHVGIARHIDAFRAIRAEFVDDPYPAWTAIEVAGFVTPGAVVEVRVVADASTSS